MKEQPNINFGDITLTVTERRTSTRKGQKMTKVVETTLHLKNTTWIGERKNDIKSMSQSLPRLVKEHHPNVIDWNVDKFVVKNILGKSQVKF